MAIPAHEIDDSQARMLVDFLVDQPGITRQRGPVQNIATAPSLPRHGVGLLATLDPQGTVKYAALTGDSGSGFFTVLNDTMTVWSDVSTAAWNINLPSAAGTFYVVDAKPALGGGLLVGVSSDYGSGSGVVQGLAYWFGGNSANYAATVTGTRGSKTVTTATGAFQTNLTPGMFLFASTDEGYTNAYIGVVQSIESETSLTLAAASPYAFTSKSATFQAIRPVVAKAAVGEITTSTASTTVTGGDTKFISQGLNSGTWQLYRQSDGAYIGKVSSVTNNTSLTLTANAAVSMASEPYVAIRADNGFGSIQTVPGGVLNAVYADRQWYANRHSSVDTTAQVWFSDEGDLESLDLSTWDGNWFKVTSSSSANEPIRALAAAYNGLIVLKETEAFIIGGNSPDSFAVNKLEDDGTICGMSVQEFGGGVIWAGREGINYYDGVQVTNLVENTLGQVWKDTIRTLDPTKYRTWSMVNRDHYFLNLESVSPDFTIIKGNTSTAFTTLTVIINMVTRAVTFATNLGIRGSTIIPASAGKHAWYLVNGTAGGSSFGWVCDGDYLFTKTGADAITCDGSTQGPAIYLESKKFNAGDSMRLKRWKQVAMNYLAEGGSLILDIVLGLNEVGQVASTSFPQSVPSWSSVAENITSWNNMKSQYSTWNSVVQSVFLPARIRMQKKSQFMAFRVYGSATPMTDAQLGPYEVVFKQQRVGRV